jgi:hypothetical protein
MFHILNIKTKKEGFKHKSTSSTQADKKYTIKKIIFKFIQFIDLTKLD